MLHTCHCRAGMLPPLKRPRTFVSTANVLTLVGMGAATGSPELRPPSNRQALQACARIARAAAPHVRCSSMWLNTWVWLAGGARLGQAVCQYVAPMVQHEHVKTAQKAQRNLWGLPRAAPQAMPHPQTAAHGSGARSPSLCTAAHLLHLLQAVAVWPCHPTPPADTQ